MTSSQFVEWTFGFMVIAMSALIVAFAINIVKDTLSN